MRGVRAGVLAMGLLLVGVPAAALEPATPVTFGDVSLALPASLGSSVDISVSPGEDPGADTFGGPRPPALVFTIHPDRAEGSRLPRVGAGDTIIRAYRIDDLLDYDAAMDQVDALQTILDDRPDLRTFATPSGGALPALPTSDLSQMLRARPIYIDTPSVSGIRYLTAYEQAGEGGPVDRFPLTSDSLVATFQGISTDGQWYLSVTQALETPLFPATPSQRDINRVNRRWDSYLNDALFKIKSAARTDFAPSLDTVDQLFRSLEATELN